MSLKSKLSVKPVAKAVFAATRPAGLEPYLPGDALPVPDVIEKDSDSVWALWSDAVDDEPGKAKHGKEKVGKATPDKDMPDKQTSEKETQPATLLMRLPDLPTEPGA